MRETLSEGRAPTPGRQRADGETQAVGPSLDVLLLIGALAAAAVAQGAYHVRGQRLAGGLLIAAVVVALRRPLTSRDLRSGPMITAAAVAAWSVVSAALAGDVGGARSTVVLLAGMSAVHAICRRVSGGDRTVLVDGVIAVGVLVAASGWVGVAWRFEPWTIADPGVWRAAGTITYANATAGFLVPLFVFSVVREARRSGPPWVGLANAALLVGIGATFSRGGFVALAIGLATAAALIGVRPVLRVVTPVAAGAGIALAGLVPSMRADAPPRPAMAVAALAVGLAAARLCHTRPRGRTAAAVLMVCGLAVVGATTLATEHSLGPDGTGRLTLSSPDRADETQAALDLAAEHPLTGVGPGNARLVWTSEDAGVKSAKYVHNEYLQTLVEYGAVGLGLVLALVGAWVLTVWRSPNRAVVASLAALAVHSALDFLWHVPLIPLAAAVLIGVNANPITQEDPP